MQPPRVTLDLFTADEITEARRVLDRLDAAGRARGEAPASDTDRVTALYDRVIWQRHRYRRARALLAVAIHDACACASTRAGNRSSMGQPK